MTPLETFLGYAFWFLVTSAAMIMAAMSAYRRGHRDGWLECGREVAETMQRAEDNARGKR